MDVSFNNVVESTRQYFQGVPTPGGAGPGGQGYGVTPYWPPSFQQKQPQQPQHQQQQPQHHQQQQQQHHQQQQQQQHQYSREGSSDHQLQQHLNSRLPSLAPFSSLPYRGSGGTLPSMSSLKAGQGVFEGASVPPRYPTPTTAYAASLLQHQQAQQQQLAQHQYQKQQIQHQQNHHQQQHGHKEQQHQQSQQQGSQHTHQVIGQKQNVIQNHQSQIQNHHQLLQNQHNAQQHGSQSSNQSSQNHQSHQQSSSNHHQHSVSNHLGNLQQSSSQSQQSNLQSQQSNHQSQQSNHQSQQSNLQPHHQANFHENHLSLQNHSQMYQIQQNHKQAMQSHKLQQQLMQNHQSLQNLQQGQGQHQYQNHQQAIQNHHSHQLMSKYQQGLQNLHPSHHPSLQNHITHHSQVISHISSNQSQSHPPQNMQGLPQSLPRQSPHASNQQSPITRQSPHLSHYQSLPSPSHHHSTHQAGLTRQSPHLSSHQQTLTRQSPHMAPQQPSPSSHMNLQNITRQSPITANHQGLTSPSSHLANNLSQQSTNQSGNQQNLFTTPTTPVSGARTTPQPTGPSTSSPSSFLSQVKRESPLDLSVKTIRQSADSTADPEHVYYTFHNDFMRGKASGSGYNQPTLHRSPLTASRSELQFTPAPQHAGVDMKKSKESYYPLPSVNSFSKTFFQQQQQQPQAPQQHLQHHHQQPQQQQQHHVQQVQRTAYPTEPKFPQNYLKRPSEPDKQHVAPPKIGRMDNWKQTIDQQIEKRFNSYLSSRAVNGELGGSSSSSSMTSNLHNQEQKQNGADKRVLSILRNSLETREARNQQQVQQQKPVVPPKYHDSRYPSLPLRQSLPSFGAINIERNSVNRLHFPRAIDSIEQRVAPTVQDVVDITDDDESPPQQTSHHQQLLQPQQVPQQPQQPQPLAAMHPTQPNSKGELDGLAAFLAARIRTKAELKQQVTPKENTKAPTPTPASSGGEQSSPRATPHFSSAYENKDLVKSYSSQDGTSINGPSNRNLLWNMGMHRGPKESLLASSIPRRRDSDSEGADIPLPDLRRGTQTIPSLPSGPPPQPPQVSPEEEEEFKKWISMCEEFMIQLKDCGGIRKKLKIKLEDGMIIKDEPDDDDVSLRSHNDDRRSSDEDNVNASGAPRDFQPAGRKPRQMKKQGPRKRKLKASSRRWQDEIWEFKRSLQIPGYRPSGWPRAPGSLPDLERLSNPPQEPAIEPDEDRKSVTKALSEEKSFLDRLMQRYSDRRKKLKKFDDKEPRSSSSELLSTPKSDERDPKNETIAGYRDDLPAEGDLPPDLKPKTSKEDMRVKIKDIYEHERPASAPPPGMTKEELRRNNAIRKSRLVKKKKGLLLKKGEVPRLIPEKRFKTFRRKLKSSGFDYIRKKKKPILRKEGDGPHKERKKKTAPMSEQEIQAEIKGWVLNKGIGETLLHRAAKVGNVDVVHHCLEKLHHNPAPRDNAGYTPLHVACTRGHLQVASLLLKYGANVSDSALGGVRPLHEAAENGFTKLVKLLLEHGADPLLATYSGSTALALATDDEARHLMEMHMASRPPPEIKQEEDSLGGFITNDQHSEQPSTDSGVLSDIDGFEVEESEVPLPNLYRLANEPRSDSWVLFHELSPLLRVKTKEALLKQLGQDAKAVLRDMKVSEFYEKAHCRHIKSSAGPKTPKVTLVKYTDTIKFLLGVETTIIPR